MLKKSLALSVALATGMLALPTLAPPAAQAQERTGADALRRACTSWRDGEPGPVFTAAVRGAALRYEEGALVLPVPERVGLEETPRGTMDLVPDEAVVADADVERDEAARLMRAQAEGKLQAVLYFQLARGRMSSTPCLVVAGGRHLRITMTPLAVSLQRDGREALRLFTERGAVIMPQGRPELTIASKFLIFDGEAADRPAIEEALAGLLPRAGACYQQALTRRPDLVGRLILAMELDREGRATEVRPEVDAAGDAGLLRCLREVFTDLRVPRLRRPGHLSVPILLQRVAGR